MSFDRIAPYYPWMELFLAGGSMQRCRTHWLRSVRQSKNVLLAGEGHGRMLEACLRIMPESRFTVLDQSERMLAQTRQRLRRAKGKPNMVLECADIRTWRPVRREFDLVVTNFFLDCFNETELQHVVANICSACLPNARWLLADFCYPPEGWRRLRARTGLSLAYKFFRVTTGISADHITTPDRFLEPKGFVLEGRQSFDAGLMHADLWKHVQ